MIVGFFDSGLGGHAVMQTFQQYFPHIPMILEMDRDNAPYGSKDGGEIRELTRKGVDKLFARGADVVILACNTASVHALRWLQTDIYAGKHILGVTVPGAEGVIEGGYKKIGVLATEATVKIRAYKERVHILDDTIVVEEVAAPKLVPLIEQQVLSGEVLERLLREYLSLFSSDIEALVLGCTHYPLVRNAIESSWKALYLGSNMPTIIDPGEESASKFEGWMRRKGYII